MRVKFTITGQTPLLMHADNVEAADLLEQWRKDPNNKDKSKAGDDRQPGWTWQSYLYSDGKHVAIPSANLMVGLRQAGAKMILKGVTTYKQASQSELCVLSEFIDFSFGKEKSLPIADVLKVRDKPFAEQSAWAIERGFKIDVRRAAIGRAKHVRTRARFDSWQIQSEMEVYSPDVLTPEVLTQLFDIAGRGGLGDWRPACKTPGAFGMFSTKLKFLK